MQVTSRIASELYLKTLSCLLGDFNLQINNNDNQTFFA